MAHDIGADAETRGRNAPEHCVTDILAVIQILRVRGLKGEPGKVQNLNLLAVAGSQRDVVEVPGIGQHVSRQPLASRLPFAQAAMFGRRHGE